MMTKTIRCRGRVQGVFFRKSTQETAKLLGIKGWVKNESNGDVLIRATGDEKELNQFIEWCHKGPIHARVDEVQVDNEEIQDFESFEIKY